MAALDAEDVVRQLLDADVREAVEQCPESRDAQPDLLDGQLGIAVVVVRATVSMARASLVESLGGGSHPIENPPPQVA